MDRANLLAVMTASAAVGAAIATLVLQRRARAASATSSAAARGASASNNGRAAASSRNGRAAAPAARDTTGGNMPTYNPDRWTPTTKAYKNRWVCAEAACVRVCVCMCARVCVRMREGELFEEAAILSL